jgi:hypothetical protein
MYEAVHVTRVVEKDGTACVIRFARQLYKAVYIYTTSKMKDGKTTTEDNKSQKVEMIVPRSPHNIPLTIPLTACKTTSTYRREIA